LQVLARLLSYQDHGAQSLVLKPAAPPLLPEGHELATHFMRCQPWEIDPGSPDFETFPSTASLPAPGGGGEVTRILVVDDEESIRFTFSSFLGDEGHSVVTAGNCREALERLGESDFDLIVADFFLGDENGSKFLHAARNSHPHCPVVVMSAYPSVETTWEAIRLGAFDYIPKPVRQRTLLAVTAAALQHKAARVGEEPCRVNLKAVIRRLNDPAIAVDKDLRIMEINDAAVDFCGFSRQSIGNDFRSLLSDCGGDCLKALSRTIERKQAIDGLPVECPSNEPARQGLNVSTSLFFDLQSAFAGAVMLIRDPAN
jgi:two-component system, NtrC family, response regulator HydG